VSASLDVTIVDPVSDDIRELMKGLKARKKNLHQYIAGRVAMLVVDNFIKLQGERRNKLGAPSSGWFADAAGATHARATEEAAIVAINHPGISRAVRDIIILPGPGRQFLAIPVIAEAYNQMAYRVTGLVAIVSGDKGVLMKPSKSGPQYLHESRKYSGKNKFTTRTIEGGAFGTVWFVLVRSVHQKQDRTLLPSDEEIAIAADMGVRAFIEDLLNLASGGGPN